MRIDDLDNEEARTAVPALLLAMIVIASLPTIAAFAVCLPYWLDHFGLIVPVRPDF